MKLSSTPVAIAEGSNGTRVRQVNPDGSQLLLRNGGRYHVEIAADTTESTTRYYSIAGQRPATPLSPTEPARARAQQ